MLKLPALLARFSLCACALIPLLAAGCGGGTPAVSGTVTFDGKPLNGGMIKFVPTDGSTSGGQIELREGRYTSEPSWNLKPGKYRVEVRWQNRTWKPAPSPTDSGAVVAEGKEQIPQRYNSKSELTADLKSGENKIDFDLKPGGPVDVEEKKPFKD